MNPQFPPSPPGFGQPPAFGAPPAAPAFGAPPAAPAFGAPAQPAAPTPAAPGSKYSGIVAAEPREPQPLPGTYQIEWLAVHEGVSPKTRLEWWKGLARVVMASPGAPGTVQQVGDEVAVLQMMTPTGAGLVKHLLLASFQADEAAFNSWAASVGDAAVHAALVGRRVNVHVSRGPDIEGKPGEYFRNYIFQPAA